MTDSTVTASLLYVGLDVGDRVTHCCFLDEERQVVERLRLPTTPEGVLKVFGARDRCSIVIEVGSQSPWLSALLRRLGHEVLVADARRVAAITRCGRKTDRRDAETLARLLQGMPEMLGSVHHRDEQSQADLAIVRARDLAVRSRTMAIQHVRGTLKVFGMRLRNCSSSAFHKVARSELPELLKPALTPILDQIAELERTIKHFDRELERVIQERHPATGRLRAVNGVGPVLSAAYVLTLADPSRFEKSRTVGAWAGLCPRLQASGDSDPQLSISKTGCGYLRRLLVQAGQYILGPFGSDSDLRRYGLRICERGGKSGKRRAVVAVARKLAVLLHRLWASGQTYEPLRNAAASNA